MKIFAYNYREFDEAEYFQKFSKEYGVELGICTDAPTLENAHLAEGYEYVTIITSKIDRELMKKFHDIGVKMISTRTIGYDHVDIEAAKVINFTAALVSMLSLETAMLAQFGGAEEVMFRRIMTGATGGVVCAAVLGAAIFMIVQATKQLKRMK